MREIIMMQVWFAFRGMLIALMFVFLLSGLDDLFIDISYFGRRIFRALFRRKLIKPLSIEKISEVEQKPIAILVPAWNESNVIARMLLNTLGTVDYENYHIFVGTYPNDEATRLEVEKVRALYPNVEAIVTPADGPTNKADCLNWVFQGIKLHEKEHDTEFGIFILHDSEDVIHPLSLKYYNFLIPRVHFIQIPVFPLPLKHTSLTYGTYMDEFAENHTKDLRVREFVSHTIPSAGVGTAISREALDYLAENNNNQVFDIHSLTEDYLMGIKLKDFKGKKIFLQQQVVPNDALKTARGKKKTEPLATREFFPEKFWPAVHQKARWTLGISLQGWEMGWTKSTSNNYFLFRDRKALFANLVVLLGYIVVGYVALASSLNAAGVTNIPPLVARGEIYWHMLHIVLFILIWRIVNRVGASWSIYGAKQGLLAIPRLIVGNLLNFCAAVAAIKRYARSKASGEVPAWGKTEHAYPSADQLEHYHRRLGDLLLDRRLVSPDELETALAEQESTGKTLGTILVDSGVLWEEDLVSTLARQRHRESVEIDPFAVSAELLGRVPETLARTHRVFPLSLNDDAITLATDRSGEEQQATMAALSEELGTGIHLKACASADLDYAIEKGYAENAPHGLAVGDRVGDRLVKKGLITEADLQEALRRQKREHKKLGDILVGMNVISEEAFAVEMKG